jgi:Ig-like domain from next to BRCA1 gene
MSEDAFATFIRRRLRDLGLTQGALAERAQLSRQSIVKLLAGDVTYPNGTLVPPGHRFEKIWDIQNGGAADWTGRWLQCQSPSVSGPSDVVYTLRADDQRVSVPDTRPGEVVRIAIWFTAPTTPCTCTSIWKLTDDDGRAYFPGLNGLDCTVVVSSV